MKLIIIGGGISGLSLAYFLLEKKPSLDITIIEAERKAGGKIWTDRTGGFLCEGGVNGFLDNRPKTLELASKLTLSPLRSNDNSRKRYIFSDGKLNLLPDSPPAFFMSNLLSLPGRLRIVGEMFVPKWKGGDETLAHFARRRLGKEAFEKLIDPMASGIFAGDPEKMSLKSCFPKVYNLEQTHGGLIKGMLRLQKEAKKTGKKVGAGPGGVLTSFYDGMGAFINAHTAFLGERLKTGIKAQAIDKIGNAYIVHLSDGTSLEANSVVCASPAFATAEMLKGLDKDLSSTLNEIYYPSVSVVCFGYRREKLGRSPDGFGFLVPFREGRKILGTLWDSSVFPNRAPEGHVLLRTMLGGARRSELAESGDEKLMDLVRGELKDIMEINAAPDFAKVYTHPKGIPQYFLGHESKLRVIDDIVNRFKGLYLTGNAYRGIGVNDCIENSAKLAERIVQGI
jgi:protoporphyrinogen/coproporphyrinogen III oxidase